MSAEEKQPCEYCEFIYHKYDTFICCKHFNYRLLKDGKCENFKWKVERSDNG